MLSGGTGDLNLSPVVAEGHGVEEMLSRIRSLFVFSVEHRGTKIDTRHGMKKADVMMERWKAIFSKYDSEGSGTLNVEDIKRMVRHDLKIAERLVSNDQIHTLFDAIDEDGGGSVEFNEFVDFVNQPSTRGALSEQTVMDSVARGVRLALARNHINIKELEDNFSSFDESGEIATGELVCNDMLRFFRKVLKLTKHECTDKSLRVAFNTMDEDGSGTMSMEELIHFIKFCTTEGGKKALPSRVPGLIAGMRADRPVQAPRRRPGTCPEANAPVWAPDSPMSRTPFCLTGRTKQSAGRLATTTSRFFPKSESEPTLQTLALRSLSSPTRRRSTSSAQDATSDAGDEDPLSPTSVGRMSQASFHKESPPRKRTWSGKLPGKTPGEYMLLKGASTLNNVEARLFEAGIDVRGHYHKLRNDSI